MVARMSALTLAAFLSIAAPQSFSAPDIAKPDNKTIHIPAPTQEAQTQAYRSYYYNFGSWPVGSMAYQDFYFTSYGGTSRIYSIYTFGTSYSAANNCPQRLYRGNSCTIRVYFRPWYTGYQTGQTTISTANGTTTIYLSGMGY